MRTTLGICLFTLALFSAPATLLAAPSSSSAKPLTKDEAFRECMRKAVDTRESFLLLSLNGYYHYIERALLRRRESILNAWNTTDKTQRKGEEAGAWRIFGNTWRTANNQLKDLRTKAWRQYRVAIVQCNPQVEDEEQGGFGFDSQF